MTGVPDLTHVTALMSEAVDRCIEHVDAGGLPFVGLVVDDGGALSDFGVNLVHETGDLQAHAEVVAMRDAMVTRRLPTLTGTTLLATGEPCGLCYRYALDHGVDKVYVAASGRTTASYGFDPAPSYQPFGVDLQQLRRDGYTQLLPVERAHEPFLRTLQMRHPESP